VPILVFLGLSVPRPICSEQICLSFLDLGPMYATDSQTSDAHHPLMPPCPWGGGNRNVAIRLTTPCKGRLHLCSSAAEIIQFGHFSLPAYAYCTGSDSTCERYPLPKHTALNITTHASDRLKETGYNRLCRYRLLSLPPTH